MGRKGGEKKVEQRKKAALRRKKDQTRRISSRKTESKQTLENLPRRNQKELGNGGKFGVGVEDQHIVKGRKG